MSADLTRTVGSSAVDRPRALPNPVDHRAWFRHCILPDGLFVADTAEGAPLRFVPLPPPTTAEVEELTRTLAGHLTARLAAASEEENDYLDPDLAALVEALFWSRDAPPGTRDIPLPPGLEAGRDEDGLQGKPLCAAVAGLSLHAAQCVQAHDREALERLLRYGLRAPFSQQRLSRRPDGKVVYRLRRRLAPVSGLLLQGLCLELRKGDETI